MELSFFSENIQFISIELIIAAFFVALVCFWLERKIFFKLFEKITKIDIAILLLIIILFSLLCVFKGFNFKSFISSDEEWELISHSKDLLAGKNIFSCLRYGMVYPLLLTFTFYFFGVNPVTVSIINFILSILSIFLVFLLSQALFGNKKISLISSFIYAFNPLVFVFSAFRMGFPTIISFFLLSITLVGVLYFRYHKINLLILLVTLIALISQIKAEYFILIFPLILTFLFFKEYKNVCFQGVIIATLFFLLFSTPYFVKNLSLREGFSSGWCGNPSQTFYNGEEHSYDVLFADQIDSVIKILSNGRFSVAYLVYDFPNFVKFWSTNSFIIVSIFAFYGFLTAFQKYKKESYFILLLFFFISTLYLADCAFFETRYAIPTYSLVVSFSAFGIYIFSKEISKVINKNNIFSKNFFLIIFLLLISGSWYFNNYQPLIFNGFYYDYFSGNKKIFDDYGKLKSILENIPIDNSNILVVHSNEGNILKILGYNVYPLVYLKPTDRFSFFESQPSQKKITQFFTQGENNYFIYSTYCEGLQSLQNLCSFIKDTYDLEIVKYDFKSKYILYSIDEF